MEEVGVKAVVEQLGQFQSDLRKINSALSGVRSEGTLLQRAFISITEGIANFGANVADVAKVALGVLLRDAIVAAIDFVKELVRETIDAGNEFQTLEIRLKRLNFNDVIKSGADYNDAISQSIDLTKDQLTWLQLLSAQSPYDATDVANTFSLARTYGFAADAAKDLTKDILNFSSGMGLSNQEMDRIIINLGQMKQQGKVTGREMTDLARGAFVPVNDVLKIMQEETGLTGEAFEEFRNTGEGVDSFISAFSTLVETRFAGSMEEMSKTFKASTDNVEDLVKGIFGLNTVAPVLQIIGERVAEFADAFTSDPERWDKLTSAATRLGEALSGIVEDVLDLLPSTESLADGVVSGVEKLADWVEEHREDIVSFFKGIGDTIRNDVIPFVRDELIPAFGDISDWVADNKEDITGFFTGIGSSIQEGLLPFFQNISDWVTENKDLIGEFFGTLGEIIGDLFENVSEGDGGGLEGFLGKITDFMQYVIDNKDKISEWAGVLLDVFIWMQKVSFITSIVTNILITLISWLLGLYVAWGFILKVVSVVGSVFSWIAGVIAAVTLPVWLLIGAVILLIAIWKLKGKELSVIINQLRFIVITKFAEMQDKIKEFLHNAGEWFSEKWDEIKSFTEDTWNGIVEFFRGAVDRIKDALQIDWGSIGKGIVDGIANGITNFAGSIISAAKNAALAAYNAAREALGEHSPSKLFMDIGMNTMKGMAIGIQDAAGLAASSMRGAVSQVSAAAVPSVSNSSVVNNTSSYNLTVNSNAASEPILQDFDMMQSLAGV